MTEGKGGRPSGYDTSFCQQAAELCAGGATDDELADFFGVSVRTLYRWQAQHEEFRQSLKAAKDPADDRVERSLFHRASGFEWVEQQPIKLKEVVWEDGKKVERERIEVVDVLRKMPPDTTAAIFWLKNRRADKWRDVHKHEHGAPGEFDDKTPDELRDFVRREAEALGLSSVVAEKVRSSRGSRTKPH